MHSQIPREAKARATSSKRCSSVTAFVDRTEASEGIGDNTEEEVEPRPGGISVPMCNGQGFGLGIATSSR